MIYRIRATGLTCGTKHECKELLEKYPCLADFGLRNIEDSIPTGCWIYDENGKAKLWYEGPPRIIYVPHIELNTLDDISKLYKATGQELIFSDDGIEIYDAFRE